MVIIVGGTNLYIEHLLWKDLEIMTNALQPATEMENTDWKEEELEDYETLKRLDPLMAEKLHPHDKRKIKRTLQVCLEELLNAKEHDLMI